MRKLHFWTLSAAIFVLCTALVPAIAVRAADPDYPPKACPYPDSPHYRPNIGETVQDNNLLLVDTNTNATLMVLDNTMLSYREAHIFWTQNCRYLVAHEIWTPDEPAARRITSIYDTLTGQRIFRSGREPWFDFISSPDKTEFLIKSVKGIYLMNETLAQPVLLFDRNRDQKFMRYYEWDMARGQLLVSFWENSGYLMVYDIHSGATLAAISEPESCTPTGVEYTKSADERYLIVYTFRGEPTCVTVYNRDSGTVVAQVNSEERTAPDAEQIALSPDGRYLVIGKQVLRVWDLANLPEQFEDRLPIYRYDGPERIIHALHFVSNEVVEATTLDGIQQWNILTGEQVSP
jgi:WD40 repeat protein